MQNNIGPNSSLASVVSTDGGCAVSTAERCLEYTAFYWVQGSGK